jgi:hypothetical protein
MVRFSALPERVRGVPVPPRGFRFSNSSHKILITVQLSTLVVIPAIYSS